MIVHGSLSLDPSADSSALGCGREGLKPRSEPFQDLCGVQRYLLLGPWTHHFWPTVAVGELEQSVTLAKPIKILNDPILTTGNLPRF